jgi:hypothetical protein
VWPASAAHRPLAQAANPSANPCEETLEKNKLNFAGILVKRPTPETFDQHVTFPIIFGIKSKKSKAY